jgi:hypothetical protein
MFDVGTKVRVRHTDEDYPLNGKVGTIVIVLGSLGDCIDYRVQFDEFDSVQLINSLSLEEVVEKPVLKS